MFARSFSFAALALALTVCQSNAQVQLEVAFPNLRFNSNPVDLQHAGDGSNRIFVVEQGGIISVFPNDRNVAQAKVFLDLRGVVGSGFEEGLLGLAFHPAYESNGFFYVNYTVENPLRSFISRFRVSASDPDSADVSSELVLIEVAQPAPNHNGGQLAFGPDSLLYMALGDGGGAGDPQENGQNPRTLLGKIHRVDVDNPSAGRNYGIPADNPFANNTTGFREEIFAYGLRNPWRFSFDPVTQWIWCGDVGQNEIEEVDVIVRGGNYGWDIMEGTACYEPSSNCDRTGLILPVWEYSHSLGSSITGGYVYRGTSVPELVGAYIYGDYGSGRIWALRSDGVNPATNTQIVDASFNIFSFGVDQNLELYVCASQGRIYRFRSTSTSVQDDEGLPLAFELAQNYPNPFNPRTAISYSISQSTRVRLSLYNVQGQLVRQLVDAVQFAGKHEVVWNGEDGRGKQQASGVYVVRLEAGAGSVQSRRMLLLR